MVAPSVLCFLPLVLLLGMGVFTGPVIGPMPLQAPRTPITTANASQVVDWGAVITSGVPVRSAGWLPGDALVVLGGDEAGQIGGMTPGPLAESFAVTVRADHGLAVSPGGESVALAAPDPYEDDLFELLVYSAGGEWVPQNATIRLSFKGAPGPLAYRPDGAQMVVVAHVDAASVIFRLDAKTGELLGRDEIPARVEAAAFALEGGHLVVGGEDGVRVLAIDIVQLREMWATGGPAISALVVTGEAVIAGQGDGSLTAWSLADGAVRWQSEGEGAITALATSPGGEVLAVGDASGAIALCDAATGARLALLRGEAPLRGLAFNLDGSLIAAAAGESLHVYGLPLTGGPGAGGQGTGPGGGPGTLSGPPPEPGGPPSDGTYPLDPPGDTE